MRTPVLSATGYERKAARQYSCRSRCNNSANCAHYPRRSLFLSVNEGPAIAHLDRMLRSAGLGRTGGRFFANPMEYRGRGLQGISTTSIAGPCLRTANVYPAPKSLRKLRSKFSLSSHRLRQSSSNRYWRRRGPKRDAAGENNLGAIAG